MLTITDAGTLTITADGDDGAMVREAMDAYTEQAVAQAMLSAVRALLVRHYEASKDRLWKDYRSLSAQDREAVREQIAAKKPKR